MDWEDEEMNVFDKRYKSDEYGYDEDYEYEERRDNSDEFIRD